MTITIELKVGKDWNKRLGELLKSIETHMAKPIEETVIEATNISNEIAPEFEEDSYSDYWKWIFARLPEYKPTPGALKNAIKFEKSEDTRADNTGFVIGFGNISRLDESTTGYQQTGKQFIGGRKAGNQNIKQYPISSNLTNNGKIMGYWAVQEYGYRGVAPKNFMAQGKTHVTNFWNSDMERLFMDVANDWNRS